MKKIIATGNAPAAIGPYSQAIDCGSFLVTSGQVPFDPATGEFVPGGITEQTRQVLTNIKAILEASLYHLAFYDAKGTTWSKPPCSCRTWAISPP